jgi:hypothetical protein
MGIQKCLQSPGGLAVVKGRVDHEVMSAENESADHRPCYRRRIQQREAVLDNVFA